MAESESSREATGKVNRGTLIFGVVWTLFSSIFLLIGLATTWKSFRVSGWDKVPCVIERFEILADKGQDPAFRADLRYHYLVDGSKFTGTRLWLDQEGSDDYEDLSGLREAMSWGPEGALPSPEGLAAECRVNPADPAESSLAGKRRGQIAGGIAFALFGGFFVMLGIGMIVWGIKGGQARAKSRGTQEAPLFVVVTAFGFFACAGLGVLGGVVLPKAVEWASMRGWKATDAEVIWGRVASRSDSDGTTYAVDLFYRYRFQGKEHRANRYDLVGGSSSGSESKHKVVRNHPPGATIAVFVDPDKPWRAVVKRDAGWSALFALFPLPFLAVGFGGLWWTFKKRNEGTSVSRPRGGEAVAARARKSSLPPGAEAGRWIRVGGGRWAAFIFLTIFALFWNGVISFGVRDAWSGLSNSSGIGRIFGGGLGLFMIPFVLIGIAVATGALYSFVALFAPRYEVKIGSDRLVPGKSTPIHWRRAGGHGQPRDFTLLLVGREEATYSQGTSTSTAKSVFHERVLFETTVPLAMDQGRVDLTIPADGLPTLHGKHNKILWLLCLRATVPRLPDLNDEREIHVNAPQKEELP